MQQEILFMTYGADRGLYTKLGHLMEAVTVDTDCHVLFHNRQDMDTGDTLRRLQNMTDVHIFTDSILTDMGYATMGDRLIPGNAHFAVLDFFKTHPTCDFYWFIEDDVVFNGNWVTLFDYYHDDGSDLIASYVGCFAFAAVGAGSTARHAISSY